MPLSRMLRLLVASGCVAASAMALPAMAADQDMAGRRLYANCAACHGTDGRPAGNGALPPLAGQPKQRLIASMQAFKAGERSPTIMHQIARAYSDEQIALIAGFLESQKMQKTQTSQATRKAKTTPEAR